MALSYCQCRAKPNQLPLWLSSAPALFESARYVLGFPFIDPFAKRRGCIANCASSACDECPSANFIVSLVVPWL